MLGSLFYGTPARNPGSADDERGIKALPTQHRAAGSLDGGKRISLCFGKSQAETVAASSPDAGVRFSLAAVVAVGTASVAQTDRAAAF